MADGFSIKIDGIRELQNTFSQLDKELQAIISEAVHDGGEVIKTAAQGKVHVISGDLKQSLDELHFIKTGTRFESQVGSRLPYAEIEEFRVGGKYPGSHSYMRYALDTKEKEVVSTIENKLESALRRYR